MKITVAESNPGMGLLRQETFRSSRDVLATANKMAMTTMSKDSDQGLCRTDLYAGCISDRFVRLFVAEMCIKNVHQQSQQGRRTDISGL